MIRLIIGGLCLLVTLPVAAAPPDDARVLPMSFEWRREGPADICGAHCRVWISAVGAITVDTPRDFERFAQDKNVRGATLVLDSSGGSVLAALTLGRVVRRLDMTTSVGRTIELPASDAKDARAKLAPDADCESMCAFVLLAGTRRYVPPEAHVLVHQIWLGDKRDDATAATYSAEDLVLVQRDIGRLAQYTVEMGGAIELIETALRVPPWERMRSLSQDELRRMRLATIDHLVEPPLADATISAAPSAASIAAPPVINERGWSAVERSGRTVLARRHPLTVEGEEIGSFDLTIACGDSADAYTMTYVEHRKNPGAQGVPQPLRDVAISVGRNSAPLRIVSSQAKARSPELDSFAQGPVPAALVKAYADLGNRSLTVETSAADRMETVIRIGNTGVAQNFPKLAAACAR